MVLSIHHYQQEVIRLDRYQLLRMATVFQWSTAWILWRLVMWLRNNWVCHA